MESERAYWQHIEQLTYEPLPKDFEQGTSKLKDSRLVTVRLRKRNSCWRWICIILVPKPPLLRIGLIEVAEDRHILLFDMHHIVSDGISTALLFDEFSRLYRGEELAPLRIQYKDYAVWQHSEAYGQLIQPQKEYWLEQLSGELPVLELPTDFPRPAVQSFDGRSDILEQTCLCS